MSDQSPSSPRGSSVGLYETELSLRPAPSCCRSDRSGLPYPQRREQAPAPTGASLPNAASAWDRALTFFRSVVVPVLAAVAIFQGVGWLRAPSLPDQAPDFSLERLDGQRVTLSDLRGQTIVLNFWATWCGPCRAEIPGFSWFAKRNPNIPVLGIAADGSVPVLRAAKRRMGIAYPVLRADDQVLRAYRISVYPTTVVVGPEGQVLSSHAGMMMPPQLAWATRGAP